MTETRWHRHPHVLWRRSLDAVLILGVDGGDPVTLAGTGPEVWELLAEPLATDTIVGVLAQAHGASHEVVEADVVPLLERLAALGAVERVVDAD
jgi:Coenzyme PQQ synthesis protein D (PqqD)